MDKQTQKVAIIGGLAVLVLGAGSYFYFSGGSTRQVAEKQAAPTKLRTRERTTKVNKDNLRTRPSRTRAERPAVADLRERAAAPDRPTGPRRTRATKSRTIKKKKELKPAS